jgi:hypothetical protein
LKETHLILWKVGLFPAKSKKKPSQIKITYKTSNSRIAKVDKKGNVRGLTAGTVTISAYVEKKVSKRKIKVLPNVKTIKLVKSKSTLFIGEKLAVKANLTVEKKSKKQRSLGGISFIFII